jgi:hypothetical protein
MVGIKDREGYMKALIIKLYYLSSHTVYRNLPQLYPQPYVPLCSFLTTFMFFIFSICMQRWSRGKSGRLIAKGSLVCFEN